MAKVAIVSLGCPKNLVDSENLLSGLKEEGIFYTPELEDADIVLVNTCGFIEAAKKESIEEILKLKHIREQNKRLLVFGCLAKRYRDELMREIPEIDGIWGVGEEDRIIEYCKKAGARGKGQGAIKKAEMPIAYSPSPIASESYTYLKIAEGCNRHCTFCVIPSIRGAFRSISPETILKKAEEHVRAGFRELIIVAQDIGNYGSEFDAYGLPALIKEITSISGDFRVRLMYLYPTTVTEELLTVVSEEDKVCKYLDMPFQHSEDRMLKAMGRSGTRSEYIRMIKRVRKKIPEVTLRTTFIVGFPGETEEDFTGLKNFIEEIRFDRLGVFTYSNEEDTPASRMKGSVTKKIKEQRQGEIMRTQAFISLDKNKGLVGKTFRALVDEVEGEVAIARLCSQAPEIDGVTIISDLKSPITNNQSPIIKPGDFVTVEITEAYDYDLKGKIIF